MSESGLSSEVSGTTPIPAPTGLNLTKLKSDVSVKVSWTNNDDSSDGGITVERSSDGGSTWSDITTGLSPGTSSYTDFSVTTGSTYDYRIKRNTDHASVTSGTSNVTHDYEPVDLSWSDNSTNEDVFRIYESTTSSPSFPGDFTQIDSVGIDITSYRLWTYRNQVTEIAVTAYNQAGESNPVKTSVVWGGKPTGDVELGNRRNAKIPSAAAPAAENKASTASLKVYRTTASNPTFPDDYTLVDTVSGSMSDFTDENSPYGTDVQYAFVPELDGEKRDPTFADTYIPSEDAATINPDINNN